MGAYINRDELLELYANTDELDISNYDVKIAVIRQNILDMPTIDIVRCGKCKWYNPWHANHTNIDGNHCRNIDRPMKPTDFCSYGERRADDVCHNEQ